MSVSGISGSSFFTGYGSSGVQNKFHQIQQGLQQLGQDLQSGNLSRAQSEFSTLEQLLPSQLQTSATSAQSGSQTSNPVSRTLSQLGQDLNSGNLSAAQSDFATLQQDLQQQGTNSVHLHHHHHGGGTPPSSQQSQKNSVSALFANLGQDLQSGNFTAAKQTYSTLQQDFLQFAGGSGSSISGSSTSGSTSLNVSA